MKGRSRISLALVLAAVSLAAAAPPPARAATWTDCAARPVPLPPARSVDPAIQELVQRETSAWQRSRRSRIPGVSVAIRWDDGREVLADAGYANLATKAEILPSTPFSLASVSKTFTSAVALLLDACGLLPLETTAKSLVPSASIDASATIRDLLQHRSGMGDWLNDRPWRWTTLTRNANAAISPLTVTAGVATAAPGAFNYSNSGFTLVTVAAERATGRPWRELLQTLLLDPLGLVETGFGPRPGAARSHWVSGGRLRPQGQAGWGPTRSVAAALRGAGDLFSSPRDLARFGELFWGNRLIEGDGSLALNGIALSTGSSWLYTLGTQVRRSWGGSVRVYGHTGGYSGTTTTLERIPALGVTIAVTANGSPREGSYADDLARSLFVALDSPPANPAGVPRARAGSLGDPEPPDPPVALPADRCGDPLLGGADPLAARWIALGKADGWSGAITALAELPDGRIVVGGAPLTAVEGRKVGGIAAWDPRYGTWSALATFARPKGAAALIAAVAVDAARGVLYVGGRFTTVSVGKRTVKATGLAQLDLSTGTWSRLGRGLAAATGEVQVRALALDPASGRLAVGGYFSKAGGASSPSVALWVPSGRGAGAWSRLGAGLPAPVEALAITPDGSITAAGHFPDGFISSFAAGGSAWESVGGPSVFADAPRELAVVGGGTVVAGTGVGWYGAALQYRHVDVVGGWSPLGESVAYPRRTAWISSLAPLPDGRLAVGGYFSVAGGVDAPHLALWDPAAETYEPFAAGLAVEPDALASSAHASLLAATRIRGGGPGLPGGHCVAAWASQPPAAPTAPVLVAGTGRITASWTAPAGGTPVDGYVVTATAKGRTTRRCFATREQSSCTVLGLARRATYAVSITSWAAPAGPSAPLAAGSSKTR